MTITIKRFDPSLPLPEYKSSGASALDLYARLPIKIEPKQVTLVPLNIALQLPANHWALLSARSSLFKKGLLLANGIGIGDEDYCGDSDEYQAALYNFSNQAVQIAKGERIVQIMILSREKVVLQEQAKLAPKNRGGFGSTGKVG